MGPNDRTSERRLDAIIVAATLAVIIVAVIGIVAIVDSMEPQPGGHAMDSALAVAD